MFPEKISRLKKYLLLTLLVLMVICGVQTARGFFEVEELYVLNDFATLEPPVITASEPANAANPFVPILSKTATVKRPLDDAANLSAKFDARNLKVTLLSSAPQVAATDVERCKSLIESTLAALANDLVASLDEMKLFFAERNPRGLSNSHLVELRCQDLDDDEVVSVLVHELGHIVDLGKLKGETLAPSGFVDGEAKIPADDPSIKFYRLSWRNETEKNFLSERRDFVSGYAMTDPFEDFAESFNFYVLHGEDFRAIKGESRILAAKYDFLKDKIFTGVEFESARNTQTGKRVWDTTLVEFDQAEFFARG
ncbi:MAG: hypothetical protein K9L85_04460 [Candidatus Peribacteraceae bacterium]|nr:hypothetical protein [Candidatus Peribacteraceae bacterium]